MFGCTAGAALIDGCLEVGEVVPQTGKTAPMTGVASQLSVFDLVQWRSTPTPTTSTATTPVPLTAATMRAEGD